MNSIVENAGPPKGVPVTVLIVEDSAIQAELLCRAVEEGGYRALRATNGVEGLALARLEHPALVITDINMPMMDGYAMCRAIRSDPVLRDTPVVLLTMLASPEDVIHGLNAGADAYLTKPYNIPSLLSRLAALLANPPGASPIEERRRLQARLANETFTVTANGPRMLSLLLSTYESAVLQNRELAATQAALQDLNDKLEQRVLDQTTALTEKGRQLEASLKEKDALLHEVHHRVKNNLQVITSLLHLESSRIDHSDTRLVLRSMQNRIQSMAILHETLYRSGHFAQVDLAAYLKRLASHLSRSLITEARPVSLTLDLVSVSLDVDQAIPCGLIVNELVSNSLKHGIPEGRPGEIQITLAAADNGSLRLIVADNGVGLPKDFNERKGKSLGLQLVSDLTRQLRGHMTIGAGTPGSSFEVAFTPGHPDPRALDTTAELSRSAA